MGCLCCCCPSVEEYSVYFVRVQPGGQPAGAAPQWERIIVRNEPPRCPNCDDFIHPLYWRAHLQMCYAAQQAEKDRVGGRYAKALAQASGDMAGMLRDEVVPEGVNPPMEELCVVCLERRRVAAFLPCGHAAACLSCSRQLEICPICRESITGVCRLFVKGGAQSPQEQLRCKHCGATLHPSLFEGHQEVCGLKAKAAQREREEEAERQSQEHTKDGEGEKAEDGRRCLECGVHAVPPELHMAVTAPCGHVVLCEKCVSKRTTCPFCCSTIQGHTVVFA